MLSTTDQLWLLQHAKGRLPSIETQAIENDIHKRIHQFWAANRLKPLLSKEWNTIGPIENIDIENSIFNDPLMTSEHLLFQNDTLTKLHLIFVLDASLSLKSDDLWHLLLLVYGLQSMANTIELIAFSTEARHIYSGFPFVQAKDLIEVYSNAIEPGYTNLESGIRFGTSAINQYNHSNSQLIFITDGGWNMGCEPSKLAFLMHRCVFILLNANDNIFEHFDQISRQSATSFRLKSAQDIAPMCEKFKRKLQNVLYR